MWKLRKRIRELTFPIRCLFIAKRTPGELLKLFFQLSDLGKAFEEPTEVIEGFAVMAKNNHVMIYTEKLKLAFNYTEGRGLALQASYFDSTLIVTDVNQEEKSITLSPPPDKWEEVYRQLSRQVSPGKWTEVIFNLPAIVDACRDYKPEKWDKEYFPIDTFKNGSFDFGDQT